MPDLNDMEATENKSYDSIQVSWMVSQKGEVTYFVNDVEVGQNDDGFDEILCIVSENPEVKVVLMVTNFSFGGKSLEDDLPFSKRYQELEEASNKKIVISLK